MTQQVSRYHPLLVALHWALAILIIADLAIGSLVLVNIPNDAPRKIEGLRAHMLGGFAILALMLLRLGVRARTRRPPEAPTGSLLLDRVVWLSHRLLYVLVIAMAGVGLALALQTHLPEIVFLGRGKPPPDFWVYPLRGAHFVISRLLMGLIALHILGALYHSVVRRDGLLARMAFGRRSPAMDGRAAAPGAAGGRYAVWTVRAILVLPTLLFLAIGWKYLSAPKETVAGSSMVLGSPAAVTDMRAEGALFWAIAVLVVSSLLARTRLLAGLVLVAVVVGFITGARALGLLLDGAAPETVTKLAPEIVLLALSGLGIFLEVRRRGALRTLPRQEGPADASRVSPPVADRRPAVLTS